MKKSYFAPLVKVVRIHAPGLLSQSEPPTYRGELASRRRHKRVWEEDYYEEEEEEENMR